MPRFGCQLMRLGGMLSLVIPLLIPMEAWSILYQCMDGAGATVFSDSPAQLRNCKVLEVKPSSPSPAVPLAPLSESPPGPSQEMSSGPSGVPFEPPPAPDFTQAVVPASEQGPTADQSETANPGPSPVAAPSDNQPCFSSVNPLNPFPAGPCPPDAVPPAITTSPTAPVSTTTEFGGMFK